MKILKRILMLLMILLLAGCEDVITVDLETAAPRLVIDASIDWIKGTAGNEQKIVLSTSTGYYSKTFPTVSGAAITVANNAGTVFSFIETSGTGEYICSNFEPVIGDTYSLTIILNGQTYTATEALTATPEIKDTILQNNTGGMAGDEIELTYYYQDDGSQVNYYLYRIKNPHVAFPQYSVEDDENSQGNLTPAYYSHEDLKAGDLVNIRLYGISKRYYDYMNKLLIASGSDDRPWPTTPSAVRGNIINQTDSQNFAFGYFRLMEVAIRDYTIQ